MNSQPTLKLKCSPIKGMHVFDEVGFSSSNVGFVGGGVVDVWAAAIVSPGRQKSNNRHRKQRGMVTNWRATKPSPTCQACLPVKQLHDSIPDVA